MNQDNQNADDETKDAGEESKKQKVHIEFPYSELIRAQIPKAFDVAEKVATEWKNEGDFTQIGLSNPLVDAVATQALQKAKQIEKKLEEKGVFTLAKIGLEMAKAQVEQLKKKL